MSVEIAVVLDATAVMSYVGFATVEVAELMHEVADEKDPPRFVGLPDLAVAKAASRITGDARAWRALTDLLASPVARRLPMADADDVTYVGFLAGERLDGDLARAHAVAACLATDAHLVTAEPAGYAGIAGDVSVIALDEPPGSVAG
jgi:hypothetical protein